MTTEETEDVMHKREVLMADGRRKLYFFTFGDEETAEAAAESTQDEADSEEASQ